MGRIPGQVKRKPPDFKLVITIALKKEAPKDLFASHGVPVHTLAALKAGALNRLNIQRDMLVVITGAGLKASEGAALWIRDSLKPIFVINIGTCGLINRDISTGEWIMPRYVANEEGVRLELAAQLPFAFSEKVINVDSVLSVKKALFGNLPETWKEHDALDMECFSQAMIFHEAGIGFNCLKFGTDYSDGKAVRDFNNGLKLFVENIKKLFASTPLTSYFSKVKYRHAN